jgi:copper homeostasis protein
MLRDARLILETGVKGLAFGILREDGSLDEKRCEALVRLIKEEKNREAVFHMAFDVCTDEAIKTLSILRQMGFCRLLTSGRAPNAQLGAENLRSYIQANQLEILPGGGIRANNAAEILRLTGADQVHGRFHKERVGSQVVDGEGL